MLAKLSPEETLTPLVRAPELLVKAEVERLVSWLGLPPGDNETAELHVAE